MCSQQHTAQHTVVRQSLFFLFFFEAASQIERDSEGVEIYGIKLQIGSEVPRDPS